MLTLSDSAEERAAREETRNWAKATIPDELRWREDTEGLLEVDRLLSEHGLLAVGWPVEYGGRAFSPSIEAVVSEELGLAGIQRAKSPSHSGVNNLGPALIAHASEEQKARYLSGILQVRELWCQGFSEPEAGSDLASVRTTARVEGDHFIINGSKIWTSGAHRATWIYALVRTGTKQSRHRGISFVVFPMTTPGVSHRPIQQITGGSEFSEVFFDDVHVPVENCIGPIDGGWAVAMTLLASERLSGRFRYASFARELETLAAAVAADAGANDRPVGDLALRDLGRAFAEIEGMAAIARRVESLRAAGGETGHLSSVNKIWWPVAHQKIQDLGLALSTGMQSDPSQWYLGWLNSRPESIYGGSLQIQRNIISERYLGMPKANR
jgi:alkylation response protein AidB-like acyl-CoA dehydrogenase